MRHPLIFPALHNWVSEETRDYRRWSCTVSDYSYIVIEVSVFPSRGSIPGWSRITLSVPTGDGTRARLWAHDVLPVCNGRKTPPTVALVRALEAHNVNAATVDDFLTVGRLWHDGARAGDGPAPLSGMSIPEAIVALRGGR